MSSLCSCVSVFLWGIKLSVPQPGNMKPTCQRIIMAGEMVKLDESKGNWLWNSLICLGQSHYLLYLLSGFWVLQNSSELPPLDRHFATCFWEATAKRWPFVSNCRRDILIIRTCILLVVFSMSVCHCVCSVVDCENSIWKQLNILSVELIIGLFIVECFCIHHNLHSVAP